MKAIIYARWSTLEQGRDGKSSLDRQLKANLDFCAEQQWEVSETVVDAGKSAYTGANLTVGNLGKLTKRFLIGVLDPNDHVLVVEELHRLSRQPAGTMLSWLTPLLQAGLTIAVAGSRTKLTREALDREVGGLVTLIVGAFGAFEFSRDQSRRGRGAWEKRRNRAREGKALTSNHRHPKWLEHLDGKFEAMPERQDVIRKIFELRLAGHGKGAIAKHLNISGIETWSGGGRRAAMWSATYVGRIVANRATIGEYQPFHHPRGGERIPAGDPIEDYYPPVISRATLERANAHRLVNQLKAQGRGRSIANLFGSKLRCLKCGGSAQALGSSKLRQNKDGSTSRHYFIYCLTAKRGGICDEQKGWTYQPLEDAVIDSILSYAMDDQHFAAKDDLADLETASIIATRAVEVTDQRMANIAEFVANGDDVMVQTYRQLVAQKARQKAMAEQAANALKLARGEVSSMAHTIRVAELRDLMDSDDTEKRYQARSRAKAALNEVIDRIDFEFSGEKAVVHLKGALGILIVRRDGRSKLYDLAKRSVTTDSVEVAYLKRKDGAPNPSG